MTVDVLGAGSLGEDRHRAATWQENMEAEVATSALMQKEVSLALRDCAARWRGGEGWVLVGLSFGVDCQWLLWDLGEANQDLLHNL